MVLRLRLVLILCIFGCAAPVWCDSVALKNGQRISGEVLSDGVDAVRIKTAAGILSFPRSQVETVEKSSDPNPVIQALLGAVELGNLEAAYIWLESAAKVVSLESLMPDIYTHWPGLNGLLPISLQASGQWESLLNSSVSSSLSGPMLAQIWYRAGQVGRAVEALRGMKPVPNTNGKTLSCMEELLAAALADNHLGLAARCIELLPAQTVERLSATDAHLIHASQLLDQKQWEKAATEFLHAKDSAPQLRRALLLRLLDSAPKPLLSSAEASRLLQVLITAVDSLPADEAFTYATRLLPTARVGNNYDSMLAVVEKLAMLDPDQAAPLEHSIVFNKRMGLLNTTDMKGQYDLAIWARERGLFSEARALFFELAKDERFSQNARLQVDLTDTREASSTLQLLVKLHQENRHEELREGVDGFLKKNPPAVFAQHARDLIQLSDYAKWANEQPNQDQAEGIFQQAQRCVSRSEYDAALAHLNRLSMDYPESAAAVKALQLRPQIERMKKRGK